MHFASDNTGPVHPTIMQALSEANAGYAPSYGTDPLMSEVETRIREIFEAPEASVYLVATGTASRARLPRAADAYRLLHAERPYPRR